MHSPAKNTNTSTRPLQRTNSRTVENFILVWLDSNIDEAKNADYINTIPELREVINTVHIFTTADECINFISDIKEEKILMISSDTLGQTTVPIVHEMPQVSRIYIFCGNKAPQERWMKNLAKVKGVFTDIKPICEVLKQATYECDKNTIPIGFEVTKDDAKKNNNLDQLDQSFMYTQLLKEILLTIDFDQQHIQEFITYCREQFASNTSELEIIDKLDREYRKHLPIWWYTYPCFLYSMLNRALRTMEIDLIVNMGFFIKDLHKDIEKLHSEQYIGHTHANELIVYRGQGLPQKDFDKLINTKGGLLSFNNFLSTSTNREVSLSFAESNTHNPDLIGILFQITIDPSIPSASFANVRDVSRFQDEEEILFSMHSVFRIKDIKQIDNNNNRLWKVKLTLTSDNDPNLYSLTEQIRKDTYPHLKGWHRMGTLLYKVGQFNKAQEVFESVLDQKSNELEEANTFDMLGKVKNGQGQYTQAITYCEKSIQIREKILSPTHSDLAVSYNNIGGAYHSMGNYLQALSYYEKAHEINQKTLPQNRPHLAECYSNIGLIYDNMGDYSKALSYYEKALEIQEKTLSQNHPDLATSYNNIGTVCNNMGSYSKALSYYEKALEIQEKTLPQSHPDLATSYNNIGAAYDSMGDYSQALSYYEKTLEIDQKILPQNQPDLATGYGNIGSVYEKMGDYSKALSYYEQALEIRQKTLPQNHPDLATSYGNIGCVYDKMGDYSQALSFHGKALEIRHEILPQNHPQLATSYACHGSVYEKIGDYSQALSYYEKVLEIQQKNLSQNHPDLATSYACHGSVCNKVGNYSKALSSHEKALEIYQATLPQNHPDLATSYTCHGSVYEKKGDYSQALSYYSKALEIQQKNLPQNLPDLATSYTCYGSVYNKMGNYSKALSYYEKAFEIRQKILPQNHPHLVISLENIGLVYYNMGDYSKVLSYYEKHMNLPKNSFSKSSQFGNFLQKHRCCIQQER